MRDCEWPATLNQNSESKDSHTYSQHSQGGLENIKEGNSMKIAKRDRDMSSTCLTGGSYSQSQADLLGLGRVVAVMHNL